MRHSVISTSVRQVRNCALIDRIRAARSRRYRARAKDCNHCPLKAKCTTSKQGRSLCRSVDEACLDRVRAYQPTEAYKKALRKRQVWVEPLFAEAKDWHGMRRFRLRRLWRVNSEALMIAAGQNLKRLLKKRGWGRRPFPAEALCVPRQSHLPMRTEAQTHISIEQLLIALCIDTLCKPLEKRETIALVYALFLTLWWLPLCSSLEAFAISLLIGRV
jgi:hypothetical protein